MRLPTEVCAKGIHSTHLAWWKPGSYLRPSFIRAHHWKHRFSQSPSTIFFQRCYWISYGDGPILVWYVSRQETTWLRLIERLNQHHSKLRFFLDFSDKKLDWDLSVRIIYDIGMASGYRSMIKFTLQKLSRWWRMYKVSVHKQCYFRNVSRIWWDH